MAVGPSLPRAWTLEDLLETTGSAADAALASRVAAAETARQETLQLAAEEERARVGERADWERRIEEAHRQGFDAGREEGEIMEQARLRGAVRAAEGALEELRLGEARWAGTIEENVCALAVIIARQVIGRELQLDVDSVLELVRNALAEFPIDQPMRIRVHPTDLSAISRQSADGDGPMAGVTRDRDARWIADAGIVPGGCVVEGRERIVDGRVDLALERVYRRLTYTNA
jgi:flagellar assembly protein FliH